MPGFGFLATTTVASTRGLAVGGEHGAVGLAGDPAGLERERSARPFDFYGVFMNM